MKGSLGTGETDVEYLEDHRSPTDVDTHRFGRISLFRVYRTRFFHIHRQITNKQTVPILLLIRHRTSVYLKSDF